MRKKVSFCIILTFVVFISGCADKKPPLESIADVKMALIKADEANAIKYSPTELELAKQKLKKVDKLIEEGKYDEAKFLAQKIAVDVRLLEKRALNQELSTQIETLNKQIDAVKKEVIKIED